MRNELIHYYKASLGLDFEPYDYQLKVAELLLDGKNVILSVPTGAGKTWASIIPFLYAKEYGVDFPQKMIYSLPLRTLANSICEDVKKICTASIQTGEYGEDPYFENDIIFSTIDQTLSNFLCFPLALSSRQANINAGSLVGSYLVFDEFHLLDTNLSMATTIGMLKMLSNLCRCCIMTATLSDDFMEALKDCLPNFEIVTLEDFPNDTNKITSLLPKKEKKIVKVIEQPISSVQIINCHKNKTIVICNRVEVAQKLYNELVSIKKNGGLKDISEENIICLHSRFFDNDRKEKEKKLKHLFGKETNKQEHAILISTQVIEAGMDISCSVMHTEISPISSFLQRAGRCARFGGEQGEIYVYDLLDLNEQELIKIEPVSKEDKAEIRQINNKYLPYDKPLCIATLEELKKATTLDSPIPKQLIEAILGNEEKLLIKRMEEGQGGGFNQNKIRDSWAACQKNHYRNTIRDIQSVEVILITDEMCNEVAKHPYRYQSLGIFKWSLVSWAKKIVKGEGPIDFDDDDWLIKKLEENNIIDHFENDEDVSFKLSKVTDFGTISAQVYLNAKYFGYHRMFGFNWQYDYSFNYTSPKREGKAKNEDLKPLVKDTFYQHNMGLIGAFTIDFLGENQNKLDFVFKELAKYIEADKLQKDDLIKFIKLMIVLHDYGKLNNNWQKPMQHYQAIKENTDADKFKEILAHTDFNSKDERDIELSKKANLHKRPPHAGVGAYIMQEMEIEFNSEYLKSAISIAIARHHSPLSHSYPDFEINNGNYGAMQKLLDDFKFDLSLDKKDYKGDLNGFETDWHGEYILYLFFVRILRICDQKATENLSKYYKSTEHV